MDASPQIKLRMGAKLHAEIKAAATANNRSLNAEVCARLERSLSEDALLALVEEAVEMGMYSGKLVAPI